MKQDKIYDAIIVGGSYAGLAAGMALGRALRKVLIIDSGNPCNQSTPHSHNFLTNDGKTPGEIAAVAKQEVSRYDSVSFLEATVTAGNKSGIDFELEVQSGEKFRARKLLFATGIKDILPALPGFSACWGISVLHCPYCHGYEVRHQKTGILANGDTGFELASLLYNWTDDLALYTNGISAFTAPQLEKLTRHRIPVIETSIGELEHQNGFIEHILFRDGTRAAVNAVYARLPFLQHSPLPQALGCALTEEGYLKTDAAQKTSVPGIYACGDSTTRMRTVANAVATGTAAGMMLNKELLEERF